MNNIKCAPDADNKYIEGLTQNNPQIINEIYTKIKKPVSKYILGKGLTREDAEDIIQDAFIIILVRVKDKSKPPIILTSSFLSYFFGICKNGMLKKSTNILRNPVYIMSHILSMILVMILLLE